MGAWRRAAAGCSLALTLTLGSAAAGCADDGGGGRFESADTVGGTSLPGQPGHPGQPGSGPDRPPTSGDPADPGTVAAPPAIPTVGVGQRVTAAGYEVVVHQVTAPAPAPDPGATPGPGHMLVTLDVELVNRTNGDRDATYLRFEVVDAAGGHYQPSRFGDRPPSGWIPADAPQRGVQLYEVPILATDLVLTVQPDLVSGVAAAVQLG
jgi:hypothetical protein